MSSRSTVAAIGESPSYVISGVHMLYAKLSSHFILVRSEYIHDLMKYIRGGGERVHALSAGERPCYTCAVDEDVARIGYLSLILYS